MKRFLLFFILLFSSFLAVSQTHVGDVTLTYSIEPANPDSFYLVETYEAPMTDRPGTRQQTLESNYLFRDTAELNLVINQLAGDSIRLLEQITALTKQLSIIHVKCEAIRAAKFSAFILFPCLYIVQEERYINRRRYVRKD